MSRLCGLQLQRFVQLRLAAAVRRLVFAAAITLVASACSFTTDLDRLKGESADAGGEAAPKCEKGVDCLGCAACESWCQCTALPSAYEGCVANCYDAGVF